PVSFSPCRNAATRWASDASDLPLMNPIVDILDCCARAAEQRDELAPPDHSITSSVSASNVGGIASPSALAVLRLTTSSSLFTCSTGNSAGLTPLRIRPVYVPPL